MRSEMVLIGATRAEQFVDERLDALTRPRRRAGKDRPMVGCGSAVLPASSDSGTFAQVSALPREAFVGDGSRPLSWLSTGHRVLATCPGCGVEGLDVVGLTKLAYTFETCQCGDPAIPHLVEQLWHREHLVVDAAAAVAGAVHEATVVACKRVAAETRRGADGAPARVHLTYEGGLRQAGRVLTQLLAEADLAAGRARVRSFQVAVVRASDVGRAGGRG